MSLVVVDDASTVLTQASRMVLPGVFGWSVKILSLGQGVSCQSLFAEYTLTSDILAGWIPFWTLEQGTGIARASFSLFLLWWLSSLTEVERWLSVYYGQLSWPNEVIICQQSPVIGNGPSFMRVHTHHDGFLTQPKALNFWGHVCSMCTHCTTNNHHPSCRWNQRVHEALLDHDDGLHVKLAFPGSGITKYSISWPCMTQRIHYTSTFMSNSDPEIICNPWDFNSRTYT